MSEQKPNLEDLGLIDAESAASPMEDLIIKNLDAMADKMNDILLTLSSFNNRISLLEQYVSFLAKKDPELGPKLQKIQEEGQPK
jgi:uncharacterized protein YecA (UPF0149 family)